MPRAKRASDERYNERRRARRELARIEKQLGSGTLTGRQRDVQEKYAARLRESIENSYIQKNIVRGMDRKSRAKLTSKSDAALRQARGILNTRAQARNASERTNALFAEKLKAAGSGKRTDVSGLDSVTSQFFYVATRRLWASSPYDQRNEVIMRRMGVDSLEEAYRIVMRENRKQIAAYREMVAGFTDEYTLDGLTGQAAEFYEGTAELWEDFRITSPIDVVYF